MVKTKAWFPRWLVTGVLLALSSSGEAWASDPWEAVSGGDDSGSLSHNNLSHGSVQQHDLDEAGGAPDEDWMVVPTLARHSYEARLNGTNMIWDFGTCGILCNQFERVNVSGAILTEDVGVVNDGGGSTPESNDRAVRWIAPADTINDFVRVQACLVCNWGLDSVYSVRFWDTTYSVPRWNNFSGQVTVFLISSLVQAPVTVNVDFYNAAGVLLATVNTTLQPHALFVLNTGTVPQLVNTSGHAYVSHTAGYGGLAGKAVALDPATGFSFDTPLVPIPD